MAFFQNPASSAAPATSSFGGGGAATGGFNFGTSTSTPAPAAGGGGSTFTFGGPAAGSAATSGSNATTAFLFGTSGSAPAASAGFSLGGAAPAPAPAAAGGFNFEGAASPPATGGEFNFGGGGFSGGNFGSTTQGAGQTFGLANTASDSKTAEGIQNAQRKLFNLYSAVCRAETSRFKHVFYNLVTPEVVRAYQGPPQSLGLPARLLESSNPNPERMVPVVVDGFDQLRERHEEQVKNRDQLEDQAKHLHTIAAEIRAETQRQRAELQRCLDENKRRRRRILCVMCKLDLARSGGARPTPREAAFVQELGGLQAEVDSPTMFRARITELASLERMKVDSARAAPTGGAHIAKQDSEVLSKLLAQQQEGLKKLLEVLRADARDLSTIAQFEGMGRRGE